MFHNREDQRFLLTDLIRVGILIDEAFLADIYGRGTEKLRPPLGLTFVVGY